MPSLPSHLIGSSLECGQARSLHLCPRFDQSSFVAELVRDLGRLVEVVFKAGQRVERAVHLLKTGNASVDEVAARVGYADGTTLRNLLRRRLELGIMEIKRTA